MTVYPVSALFNSREVVSNQSARNSSTGYPGPREIIKVKVLK